nr:MAG TPA: hypothetical protein [Caudoviricetes sp.]
MIKYSINKEKRTVVAFFAYSEDPSICGRVALHKDLVWYLYTKYRKSFLAEVTEEESVIPLIVEIVTDFVDKYVPDENCIRGIAKCNPKDVFEENLGMKIARTKLIDKERKIFDKFKNYFNKKLERAFNELRYVYSFKMVE